MLFSRLLPALLLSILSLPALAGGAKTVYPPYKDPKVVFEFFLDDPAKISTALHWVRSYMNPLLEEPYNMAPEFMDIVVVIHGTEIVTTVKHNYPRYKDVVERMRYYDSLGVRFRLCGLAAADYAYRETDFHDFFELVPSAITEIAYWQQQGYGLVIPQVLEKKFSTEEIR